MWGFLLIAGRIGTVFKDLSRTPMEERKLYLDFLYNVLISGQRAEKGKEDS